MNKKQILSYEELYEAYLIASQERYKYKEVLDRIKNYLEKQVQIYGGGGLAQEQLENFNELLEEIE